MADPKFFTRSRHFTIQELADISGAVCAPEDADYIIEDVASLQNAGKSDVSFLDNVKYKEHFLQTQAAACFVHPDVAPLAPEGLKLLVSNNPYKAYALAAQAFYPEQRPKGELSDKAFIHKDAHIGENCTVEAGVYIAAGVKIGANTWIESGCVIRENVEIGEYCHIQANSTLTHCVIGDHSRLYSGVRVGQDGFGFAIDPAGHVKVPQLGRVIIENHVEIGANTTIDRGAGPDTVIGQGTWIDNLVQIGHNVRIGKGCVIVSQVGISGSTEIDDFVAIGGQVGIAGHLKINKGARIAAQSGVMRDIPAGEEHMGYPAIPLKQYMKQVALLKRLIKKDKSA